MSDDDDGHPDSNPSPSPTAAVGSIPKSFHVSTAMPATQNQEYFRSEPEAQENSATGPSTSRNEAHGAPSPETWAVFFQNMMAGFQNSNHKSTSVGDSRKLKASEIYLPQFDPDDCQFTAAQWCDEIEHHMKNNSWTDYETRNAAFTRLQGRAKKWAARSYPLCKTWEELKERLTQQFISTRRFYDLFRDMVEYTSDQAATYIEYSTNKVALIDRLDTGWGESNKIEVVIYGITDVQKMGKEDKEDSGFGFKDRAKAEETLKLLEQHDMNYRRLTVRGLLGRAKRVLSLTKAEDKIKNIKEAMEVFEKWLADLDANKEKKPEKRPAKKEEKKKSGSDKESSSDDEELPSESVSGLGFKDASAAEQSLKVLEGRDPDYQLLAVKGLIGRAKRVLTCTRDETKLSNIKEAMSILEKFIDDFDNMHLSRQNNPYLSAGIVRTAHQLAGDKVTAVQREFLAAYSSVRGEYKRLRNVTAKDSDHTWDVVRNNALKELKEKHANAKLFNEKDEPTEEHLELLVWAYSPEAAKVKKVIKETKEDKKSKEDKGEENSKEQSEEKERNDRKRARSSDSDDETQSKKNKE